MLGWALVCGRLAASGGATGRADGRAGADSALRACAVGASGDALRVALTGLGGAPWTRGAPAATRVLVRPPGVGTPRSSRVSTASAAAHGGADGPAGRAAYAPRAAVPRRRLAHHE